MDVITNNLAAILDGSNPINEMISENISSYAIGAIKKRAVRRKFCEEFDLLEIEGSLELIAKATAVRDGNKKGAGYRGGKYKHGFCLIMDDGKKAIIKQSLPKALEDSSLFKTGVDVET